jgi:hypothetical protein
MITIDLTLTPLTGAVLVARGEELRIRRDVGRVAPVVHAASDGRLADAHLGRHPSRLE